MSQLNSDKLVEWVVSTEELRNLEKADLFCLQLVELYDAWAKDSLGKKPETDRNLFKKIEEIVEWRRALK